GPCCCAGPAREPSLQRKRPARAIGEIPGWSYRIFFFLQAASAFRYHSIPDSSWPKPTPIPHATRPAATRRSSRTFDTAREGFSSRRCRYRRRRIRRTEMAGAVRTRPRAVSAARRRNPRPSAASRRVVHRQLAHGLPRATRSGRRDRALRAGLHRRATVFTKTFARGSFTRQQGTARRLARPEGRTGNTLEHGKAPARRDRKVARTCGTRVACTATRGACTCGTWQCHAPAFIALAVRARDFRYRG